jgi:hypothetical protein
MRKLESLRGNNSGQLLIVAALVIAMIISSTTVYIYELGRTKNSINSDDSNNFSLALKQSVRSTVISSIANTSSGGEKAVLKANLDVLSQAFRILHQPEIYHLSYTLLKDSRYDSGVWLSWNTRGLGVSGAYTGAVLNVFGLAGNMTMEWTLNITTSMTLSGFYNTILGNEKLVNLSLQVYNEGAFALAKNISVLYEDSGIWTPVDSDNLTVSNYGNGTYSISFVVNTSSTTIPVSTPVFDLREIFVRANVTCSET